MCMNRFSSSTGRDKRKLRFGEQRIRGANKAKTNRLYSSQKPQVQVWEDQAANWGGDSEKDWDGARTAEGHWRRNQTERSRENPRGKSFQKPNKQSQFILLHLALFFLRNRRMTKGNPLQWGLARLLSNRRWTCEPDLNKWPKPERKKKGEG